MRLGGRAVKGHALRATHGHRDERGMHAGSDQLMQMRLVGLHGFDLSPRAAPDGVEGLPDRQGHGGQPKPGTDLRVALDQQKQDGRGEKAQRIGAAVTGKQARSRPVEGQPADGGHRQQHRERKHLLVAECCGHPGDCRQRNECNPGQQAVQAVDKVISIGGPNAGKHREGERHAPAGKKRVEHRHADALEREVAKSQQDHAAEHDPQQSNLRADLLGDVFAEADDDDRHQPHQQHESGRGRYRRRHAAEPHQLHETGDKARDHCQATDPRNVVAVNLLRQVELRITGEPDVPATGEHQRQSHHEGHRQRCEGCGEDVLQERGGRGHGSAAGQMCQFDGEILTSRPQCQSLKKPIVHRVFSAWRADF